MFEANLAIQEKVKEILTDSDTKEWIETIDSESAKINYQKHLAEYLLDRQLTINDLVRNFKKDEISEIKRVQAFVNKMIKRLAPGTVANYVSAIKSRMQYDGIQFIKNVKILNRTRHPTVEDEVVPTKDQIISFLRNAKHGTQSIIALIAFLGVRFNVIADLRVKDFLEMRITEDNDIIFEKVPTRIKVRSELSKNGKEYQTFLIEFGCQIIRNSLLVRMKNGEKLDSNSFIVPIECKSSSLRKRANFLARRCYTVFNKVGYKYRPYSLKNFFATALMNSGLEQNWQTFFMGHSGVVQNEYTVRRQQPTEQIEEMRQKFKEKIEPYLIPQVNNSDATVRKEFKKLAKAFGLDVPEEADTDDTIAEIAVVYKSALDDLSMRTDVPTSKQRRISVSELDNYLEKGWEYQDKLPNGDLIVRQVII